jgi:hypothetical protein
LQLRTLSSSDRRQPAAGRKPRLQRQRAGFPRFEVLAKNWSSPRDGSCNGKALVFDVSSSHTEYIPRGAYAPRSYVAVRAFVGEKTIFAMHERTFTRAATVSPPWVCKSRVRRRCDEFWRLELACGAHSTGGLRPPLLCAAVNVCRRKNDFCDAGTHIHKSGGRQPAVGMSNAVAIADAFVQRPASAACRSETTVATATRWISAFRDRIPSTSHGGLTPPALTLQSERLSAKKTIFAMHERRFTRAAGVSPPWA